MRKTVFHSILFGILGAYICTMVLAPQNDIHGRFEDIVLPFFLLWGGLVSVFLLISAWMRDGDRAFLLAYFLGFMFFKYDVLLMQVPAFALWALLLLLAGGGWLITRPGKIRELMGQTLIAYTVFFACYNGIQLLLYYDLGRYDLSAVPPKPDLLNPASARIKGPLPDIYFVVLDAYAGNETLKRLFDYDNTAFLDDLRGQGFYVADRSRSAYSQTMLSISSTLNLNYLQDDIRLPHTFSFDRRPVIDHYLRPRLTRFLKSQGYDLHVLSMAYNLDTSFNPEMLNIRSPDMQIRAPLLLVSQTPFYEILRLVFGPGHRFFNLQLNHYETTRGHLAELKELIERKGDARPKFVYAHFLLPHPPFLFNPDGSFNTSTSRVPFTISDGKQSFYNQLYEGGWMGYYREGYLGQLKFVNGKMEELARAIHADTGRPKVLFIQSDHGSRMHENFSDADDTDQREVFPNLNAVYFSDGDYSGLTPDISPLNLMRLTVDKYFGFQLPRLPQKQWFSAWRRPYEFIDETGKTWEN